jgi:hypothetical protein
MSPRGANSSHKFKEVAQEDTLREQSFQILGHGSVLVTLSEFHTLSLVTDLIEVDWKETTLCLSIT